MDASSTPADPPTPVADRYSRWLLGIALLLGILHVAARLIYRTKHALHPELGSLLDMSEETGLSTWFTVSLMLLLGVACLVLARRQEQRRWFATGVLFIFLSLDDAAMIHERVGKIAHQHVQLEGVYTWLLVVAPVFAIAGGLVLFSLWCDLRQRPRHRRLLILGFACMLAALGCEALESSLHGRGFSLRGIPLDRYVVPVEETLELCGPIFLLHCVTMLIEQGLEHPEPRPGPL